VNIFFCCLDGRGIWPETLELKRVNLSIVSLSNLKFFDILLGKLDSRLNAPFQLVFRQQNSFEAIEKSLIARIMPNSLPKTGKKSVNIGVFSVTITGDLTKFSNYPLLWLIGQSELLDLILEFLSKTEVRGVFAVLLEFLASLLEISEENARKLEERESASFWLECLMKNKDFLDSGGVARIVRCCCRNIEGNKLILHGKLFRMVFHTLEMYAGVLTKPQQRNSLFTHISEKLLDSSHNIFYK
jgi:hypothetical protein